MASKLLVILKQKVLLKKSFCIWSLEVVVNLIPIHINLHAIMSLYSIDWFHLTRSSLFTGIFPPIKVKDVRSFQKDVDAITSVVHRHDDNDCIVNFIAYLYGVMQGVINCSLHIDKQHRNLLTENPLNAHIFIISTDRIEQN